MVSASRTMVALFLEHMQHAPAGAQAVEVTVQRRAAQRAFGHFVAALEDVDQRRRRARRQFLAQHDGAVDRRVVDAPGASAILAHATPEPVELLGLEALGPAPGRAQRDAHEAAIGGGVLLVGDCTQQPDLAPCTLNDRTAAPRGRSSGPPRLHSLPVAVTLVTD